MQIVNATEKNKRSISKIFSPVLSALFPAVASMLKNQSIAHRFSIKEQARFSCNVYVYLPAVVKIQLSSREIPSIEHILK